MNAVAPNIQPSPRVPLQTILRLYAALSGVQIRLDTSPQVFAGLRPGTERAWINVSIISMRSIGIDEVRGWYDADADVNRWVLVGQRQVVTQLQARSYDATLQAYDLIERVKFRLHTDGARAIFAPDNLSIASSGRDMAVRIYSVPDDEEDDAATRVIMAASCDITWNWLSVGTPDNDGNFIEQVNGGGVIPGKLTE